MGLGLNLQLTYRCASCGKVSVSKDDLNQHMVGLVMGRSLQLTSESKSGEVRAVSPEWGQYQMRAASPKRGVVLKPFGEMEIV